MIPKVRAWHMQEKRMCQVLSLHWLSNGTFDSVVVEWKSGRHSINGDQYDVSSGTLKLMLQAPGHDTDRTDWYEDDVIREKTPSDQRDYIVCRDENDGQFFLRAVEDQDMSCMQFRPLWSCADIEEAKEGGVTMTVIGNKYQHPDLLPQSTTPAEPGDGENP